MVRELTSELRLFEGLRSEFSEAQVLAWRIDTRPTSTSTPRVPVPGGAGLMPPQPERMEVALLWARLGPLHGSSSWALVQGWRRPGEGRPWQRTMINRELSAPLKHVRPGEDADGTWHGYQRYDRPPTSSDACSFAALAFLTRDPSWQPVAGGVRRFAWTRVLGESPVCRFPETRNGNRMSGPPPGEPNGRLQPAAAGAIMSRRG